MIQKESGTSGREMYQVFNMGHRMELYVSPEKAEEIISISKSFNIDTQIVGRVEAASNKKVTLDTPYGVFEYN
jgi:phosphoribosylformylglycinamidine cyclo-ligase